MPNFDSNRLRILTAIIFMTLGSAMLHGCMSADPRTRINIDYYDVNGASFEELERQISLHGPKVPGVGEAIASASLRMIPDVHMAEIGDQCRVSKAQIRVEADVTLPRFNRRHNMTKEDARLFKTVKDLENYARQHEAVHVAIAEKYARLAERRILALPPQENCEKLQKLVVKHYNELFEAQEKEQNRFDRDEHRRLTGKTL